MMKGAWADVLTKYGQQVTIYPGGQDAGQAARAFVQALREGRGEQLSPSPLGLRREERFLYLGAPDAALQPGDRVDWAGRRFQVQSAHPVYAGREPSHQWAVLRPRDGGTP